MPASQHLFLMKTELLCTDYFMQGVPGKSRRFITQP